MQHYQCYNEYLGITHLVTAIAVTAPLSRLRRRWLRVLCNPQQSALFSGLENVRACFYNSPKFECK